MSDASTGPSSGTSFDTGRPTWCDVDLGALVRNYDKVRAHAATAEVVPVVKADAYGHGAQQCGAALVAAGARCLGVAYVEEGVALRNSGIGCDIHVLGGAVERQIPLFLEHDLTFTAPSVDKLNQIDRAATAAGVVARAHLKIDTGMERIGVHHYNAPKLFEAAQRCVNVEVVGVFSHFADAAEPADPTAGEPTRTLAQLGRFESALGWFDAAGLRRPLAHIANSAATIRLPRSHLDRVRVGISLYGAGEFDDQLDLEPVLSWHSEVVYVKVVPAGAPVGYGGAWRAPHDTRLITLPVGYADGYPQSQAASDEPGATVLVNGEHRPVAGRVCMDQTMVDLGDGTAYNGDVVTLIGHQCTKEGQAASLTAADLARAAGCSTYELLTHITPRVPRRYVAAPSEGRCETNESNP